MRIVTAKRLLDYAEQYPKAARYLGTWAKTVRGASWRNLAELRRSYPGADLVRVASGRPVIVFNVCGNTYRLIAAMHFNSQMAYTLRFLTHAEYDRDDWKDEL